MSEIISKELLSEVLEVDIVSYGIILFDLEYDFKENMGVYIHKKNINIHELAHKCKEWAIEQGYIIQIMPFCILVLQIENSMEQVFRYEKEDMENQKPYLPEYEFKACQWILENKEK